MFAAYLELVGGEPIVSVAQHNDSGHGTDPDGVAELEQRGSIEVSDNRIMFSDTGEAMRERLIAAIRREAENGNSWRRS